MASFTDALRALGELSRTGVIEDYAVAGAMAIVFWAEPIPTYDLDVLVLLPKQPGPIVSLEGLVAWATARGYPLEAEHILVEGVPVQFLPSHNKLADEAIETAETFDYEGVSVRVVRPEYLIALYLEPSARTMKRRERAAALREVPATDQDTLKALMERFNIAP